MDSGTHVSVQVEAGPEGIGQLEGQLRDQVEAIIGFSKEDSHASLLAFDSSSTPRNPNLLLLNELRARDLGVAPGAVVGGRVDWHGQGASICWTVGGSATPVAANTLPQVPWASLRSKNRLPSCSTWAYRSLTRSRITSSHSSLWPRASAH